MTAEVTIYCDESEEHGEYYSNFFGGVLVRSADIDEVRKILDQRKIDLHFHGEVKWTKVTSNYLAKYISLVDTFFELIAADRIKVRMMFTQNIHEAMGLSLYHRENAYFLHYYQFVKHAFGLQHSVSNGAELGVRLYFDRLPDTREKAEQFKDYLVGLNRFPIFERNRIRIKRDQVAEVDSRDHALLQCLDIVLGSIGFRLNDKHLIKPPGSRVRGKRTIAKEKLYEHINRRIRAIYPNFNIGVSTADAGDIRNRWLHPYRHWCFLPGNRRTDLERSKRKRAAKKK
jgi:hypothetical protein